MLEYDDEYILKMLLLEREFRKKDPLKNFKEFVEGLLTNLPNYNQENLSEVFNQSVLEISKFYKEENPELAESMVDILMGYFKGKPKTQILSETLARSDIDDSLKLFLCENEYFSNELSIKGLLRHIDEAECLQTGVLSIQEENSIRKHIENIAIYCLLLDGGKSGESFGALKTSLSTKKNQLSEGRYKLIARNIRKVLEETPENVLENFRLTHAGLEIDAAAPAAQSMLRK